MAGSIVVHHLASEKEQTFLPDTEHLVITPEYAVAYCYAEEHHRLSEFFSLVHQHQDDLLDRIRNHYPIRYGSQTIGCGDWACLAVTLAKGA